MASLDTFFEPTGVAVIGATDTDGKIGNVIVGRLLANRAAGVLTASVYPVNPNVEAIDGEHCYDSVSDIDAPIDLAIVAIPAPLVPDAIEECGQNEIPSAIVVTGGFGELGEEGAALEERMAAIGEEYGVRIIGPNCVGVFDPNSGVDSVFIPEDRMARPEPGPTSFISQSGAFVATMLDWAAMEDFGINKTVSYGNKADVDETDLLTYLEADPGTSVIAMYTEGIDDGRAFLSVAREVSLEKPIIAVKSGRSSAGAAAAASHTGSLAGSDAVYSSAFAQAGVLRAVDFFHMFDLAKAFGKQAPPAGRNVAIVTNGGGAGVMATDACEEYGLELAELSTATTEHIRDQFPPHAVVGNPTDVVGDTDKDRYDIAIDAMLEDDAVDALMVIVLFQSPILEPEVVDVIAEYAADSPKPVVAAAMGGANTKPHADRLEGLGVPTYPSPRRAARALAGLAQYGEYRRKRADSAPVAVTER